LYFSFLHSCNGRHICRLFRRSITTAHCAIQLWPAIHAPHSGQARQNNEPGDFFESNPIRDTMAALERIPCYSLIKIIFTGTQGPRHCITYIAVCVERRCARCSGVRCPAGQQCPSI
jgi:hypothetical protein